MKEYLCLVTANQRFYSPTTKAVLYTSILRRSEQFSPNRFRHAWEMLATYAANLLGQPWRKEFNEIRVSLTISSPTVCSFLLTVLLW